MSERTYDMEELIPIVAELAERYNGFESTSMTYEKAQQLMKAVQYCIHEYEMTVRPELLGNQYAEAERLCNVLPARLSAREAYTQGYTLVLEKAKQTRQRYNSLILTFQSYGNRCLDDTITKGMPEFFKWYDAKYKPQDTILTLDYPVLWDLQGLSGVDAVFEYLGCICLEQEFLQKFHSQFVRDTLERHSLLQEELIENICSIVLQNTLARIFIKKPLDTGSFSETDYKQLRNIFENSPLEEMKEQLQVVLAGFLSRYYENSDRLQHYLAKEPENLAYRMQNAMGYDTLEQLFH